MGSTNGSDASTAPVTAPEIPTVSDEDKPLIWVNGRLVPKSQATVSVYDHGLLYGDGVFEGIRIYNGKIFKCDQHIERLWASAERIKLNIHISKQEMVDIQRQCVEANGLTDGYIRLIVTRGVGTLGLNPYACPEPGIICIADTIRLYPEELYQKGMKVVLAERPRIPIDCLDPRIKSLNYLNNILAKMEALDQGLFEVIMLNTEGKVSEGSGDNIFMVKDGAIHTPPSTAGILEGITRRFVMNDLCPQLGIDIHERDLTMDDLYGADEVFLTGSAAEIIAVTEIGDRRISEGQGPIVGKLRDLFRQIVTSDNVPED